jgi:hypothetical protein
LPSRSTAAPIKGGGQPAHDLADFSSLYVARLLQLQGHVTQRRKCWHSAAG